MQTDTNGIIQNSKLADSSGKIIFGDNVLCSQFLRDYIDLPYFKDIRPEDIEDVSEQYVPLFAEERNADRVKKVSIRKETPFFLISLIEHKSVVDYNVSMQIFRYMVYIWETYAKEAEKMHKGITKQVDFKYPPILPIVYYEGAAKWTVPFNFRSRIIEGDTFGQYVPNFEYYLIPLRKYSNEELLAKRDEISLVMLINRMRNEKDIEAFRNIPEEKVNEILRETPEHLLDIISNVLRAFLLKMNLPQNETEELVGKVKEKKMGELFEDMTFNIREEWQAIEASKQEIEASKQEIEASKQEIEASKQEIEGQRQEIEGQRQLIAEEKEGLIRIFVNMNQKMRITKETVLQMLQNEFKMAEKEASEKLNLYWME